MENERATAGWFDDAMTRRAVFGLLGLTALTTACSSTHTHGSAGHRIVAACDIDN